MVGVIIIMIITIMIIIQMIIIIIIVTRLITTMIKGSFLWAGGGVGLCGPSTCCPAPCIYLGVNTFLYVPETINK